MFTERRLLIGPVRGLPCGRGFPLARRPNLASTRRWFGSSVGFTVTRLQQFAKNCAVDTGFA